MISKNDGAVLIVDDEQNICDAIAVVVRRIGHEVHFASTFSEGSEKAR